MKTRLTAALSLTGVLVAGSAAAMVNTQVLKGSSPASTGPRLVTPQAVTTVAGSTTTPTLPAVTSTPGAPVGTQAAYQIGDAGVVVIDTAGNVLTLVSATPNPGWTVVSSEQEDAFHVEVKLRAGSTLVEFHANYLFGVVGTSVESKDLSAPVTTARGSTTSAQPTHSTEDGSDDHGSDDHGSDDHGGDDD